jgi:LPXTG-motif cell wall-anchored protein
VQNIIPEFSSEFFVVIGLTAMMFGLMVARRRRD